MKNKAVSKEVEARDEKRQNTKKLGKRTLNGQESLEMTYDAKVTKSLTPFKEYCRAAGTMIGK